MEMRRAIKKPMTERAILMLIHKLEKLHEKGHDVNACLDQSTLHCWQDVYPLKDADIPNLKREMKPREPERTSEQKAADNAARLRVMAALRPAIKLVKAA